MDAQAYLLRHGWSGPGNPLNPNARPGATSGLGLTRPILVARRKGNAGVGNKTTKDPTNQWWLRGFEDALKGVGAENNNQAAGGSSRTPNALTSELYRFFVRGEVVPGSFGEKSKVGVEGVKDGKKKRKEEETKEERKARKEERKLRKEARRLKREEKLKRKAEREARRAARKIKREKKAAAKLVSRKEEEDAPRPQYECDYPTPPMTEGEQEQELKQTESKPSKDRTEKKRKEKKDKTTSKDSKKRKSRETSTEDGAKKSKKSKTTFE
ncbi:uncharacterized protein BO97DRAFT_439638 [Aspergillus homomorphus CBS 101889]|uniref:G-patch domain-containing protein n=1 Tax=Aspergillus homomorphus (strain CBS 101889) TaxID=1450537 RepID=A0A395IC37_ASPHC|nr:hypothetical protein BO97DRAFT_439638 [Aspergillus homomorphus CBS 101889]RAL16658.1 hypothetical protein BO97DRAFT_439638 [Aspergillus homomorphus CBS 101889]